jgi:hypothetical protein
MRGLLKGAVASSVLVALVLTGCSSPESDGAAEAPNELAVGVSEPVPNLTPGRQSNAFGLTLSIFSPLTSRAITRSTGRLRCGTVGPSTMALPSRHKTT